MADDRTADDLIKAMGKLLEKLSVGTKDSTGACVYNAGGKTYCAVLSQSNCSALGGVFTAGGKCP